MHPSRGQQFQQTAGNNSNSNKSGTTNKKTPARGVVVDPATKALLDEVHKTLHQHEIDFDDETSPQKQNVHHSVLAEALQKEEEDNNNNEQKRTDPSPFDRPNSRDSSTVGGSTTLPPIINKTPSKPPTPASASSQNNNNTTISASSPRRRQYLLHNNNNSNTTPKEEATTPEHPKFVLPPALPPLPPPPTSSTLGNNITPLTMEQVRLQNQIRTMCLNLAKSYALTHNTNNSSKLQVSSPKTVDNQNISGSYENNNGSTSPNDAKNNNDDEQNTIQVAIFENNQCTWQYKVSKDESNSIVENNNENSFASSQQEQQFLNLQNMMMDMMAATQQQQQQLNKIPSLRVMNASASGNSSISTATSYDINLFSSSPNRNHNNNNAGAGAQAAISSTVFPIPVPSALLEERANNDIHDDNIHHQQKGVSKTTQKADADNNNQQQGHNHDMHSFLSVGGGNANNKDRSLSSHSVSAGGVSLDASGMTMVPNESMRSENNDDDNTNKNSKGGFTNNFDQYDIEEKEEDDDNNNDDDQTNGNKSNQKKRNFFVTSSLAPRRKSSAINNSNHNGRPGGLISFVSGVSENDLTENNNIALNSNTNSNLGGNKSITTSASNASTTNQPFLTTPQQMMQVMNQMMVMMASATNDDNLPSPDFGGSFLSPLLSRANSMQKTNNGPPSLPSFSRANSMQKLNDVRQVTSGTFSSPTRSFSGNCGNEFAMNNNNNNNNNPNASMSGRSASSSQQSFGSPLLNFQQQQQMLSSQLQQQQKSDQLAEKLASDLHAPNTTDLAGKGDLKTFKHRVKAAFATQAKIFQKEIKSRDVEISNAKALIAKFQEGGEQFNQWNSQLEEKQKIVDKQDEKIKSLVKLLERTGVAMKKLEKRLAHEMHVNDGRANKPSNNNNNNNALAASSVASQQLSLTARSGGGGGGGAPPSLSGTANNNTIVSNDSMAHNSPTTLRSQNRSFTGSMTGGSSPHGQNRSFSLSMRRGTGRRTFGSDSVDWTILYDQVKDFDIENHDNATIVRDIVELITNLKDQVQDLEIQYDTAVDRFNERDKLVGSLKKENATLTEKLDEADGLMEHMLSDIRKLQDDGEKAELTFSQQKKSLELDKENLLKRVIELESNIAKSVESKPFFVGLGRSLAVLPFLRYEGRVKNLDLPKADVEAMIQRIWAKRDPDRSSLRRAQLAISHYLFSAYPGHSVYDQPVAPLLNADDEITDLVDYGNVKFVRRTGTGFIDFVTQLLLEKSASLLYGGEAFEFDPATSGFGGARSTHVNAASQKKQKLLRQQQQEKNEAGGFGLSSNNAFEQSASNLLGTPQQSAITNSNNNNSTGTGATGTNKRRHRSVSQTRKNKGDQLRGANRDWKNNPAFCVPTQVAEIAYSLMEGCERFKYDADIELFRAIVREEVPELAWFDQMVMLAKLKASLLQAGRIRSGRTGVATVQVIMQTLYEFFPCKDRESFSFLKNALFLEAKKVIDGGNAGTTTGKHSHSRRQSGSQSNLHHASSGISHLNSAHQQQEVYNMMTSGDELLTSDPHNTNEEEEELLMSAQLSIHDIFESNQYGNQGPFAEAIRDQHLEESCMYSAELATAASMAADPSTGRAAIEDIRFALQEVDPLKSAEEVDDFISKVVAILLDEDGVDPFDSVNNNSMTSASVSQQQQGNNTNTTHDPFLASTSRGVSPAPTGSMAIVPSSGNFTNNTNDSSDLLSVPSISTAKRQNAGNNQSSANFRAHELMVMLEEGRVLRKVADTDLVDCERFASACRGVFSKRFGPRTPQGQQSGVFGGGDGASKFDVFTSNSNFTKSSANNNSGAASASATGKDLALADKHKSTMSNWKSSVQKEKRRSSLANIDIVISNPNAAHSSSSTQSPPNVTNDHDTNSNNNKRKSLSNQSVTSSQEEGASSSTVGSRRQSLAGKDSFTSIASGKQQQQHKRDSLIHRTRVDDDDALLPTELDDSDERPFGSENTIIHNNNNNNNNNSNRKHSTASSAGGGGMMLVAPQSPQELPEEVGGRGHLQNPLATLQQDETLAGVDYAKENDDDNDEDEVMERPE